MLRTTKQQKRLCGICPIAKVADLVGDSYTILIVRDLLKSPKRFGDLEASLSGISTRTLTKKLKALEEFGIIKRDEFIEKPPRVVYSLTKKGLGLNDITEAMNKYGKKYLSKS